MRALSQLSKKTGIPIENIENIIIWGNHSATQYPDASFTKFNGKIIEGMQEYFQGEFIEKVAKRGAEIIDVCGKSSAASAAAAICEHMHDWWFGNQQGGWVSMGVIVEGGKYGIDGDLCFSYPCNVNE